MKVSAREKKVLYMGIALAVVILIYYVATSFSPSDGESLVGKISAQENLLRLQKELLGREDFFKKRIEDAEIDIEQIRGRLLPVNNVSAGATELQRVLNDFAEQSGSVITTRSNLQEKKVADSDSLTKISVQVRVECTLEDLVNFLIAIKNYDRFLTVERLVINTTMQQKQLVIRRPLDMIIAGYISVSSPESTAKSDEDIAQAAPPAAHNTERR